MTFSSMYIATTGMIAFGTGLQTISNNLANIETNGFKTMRTNYSDLFSKQLITSAPWPQQKGHGAQVQSIQSMFTQGAFRITESQMDLALAGDGFFNVRSRVSYHLPKTEEIMYTRAGAYTLDRNGYMEDPSGNILQGWAMSLPRPGETPVRLGSPTDVQITTLIIPPLATSVMRQIVNLEADSKTAYNYPAYELAARYAREQAEIAGQAARGPAEQAVWNSADQTVTSASLWFLSASISDEFNRFFLERYIEMFQPATSGLTVGNSAGTAAAIAALSLAAISNPSGGQITAAEFSALTALALEDMYKLASSARTSAELTVWNSAFNTQVTSAAGSLIPSTNSDEFNRFFLKRYIEMFQPATSGLTVGSSAANAAAIAAMSLVTTSANPLSGQITAAHFSALNALALEDMYNLAASAGLAAQSAVWGSLSPDDPEPIPSVQAASSWSLSASNKEEFNRFFLERYLEMFPKASSALGQANTAEALALMRLVTPPPEPDRSLGQMTALEFSALTALALADMDKLAAAAGQDAYAKVYNTVYDTVYQQYTAGVPAASQWTWEGDGYAGAWDGRLNPPMDPGNYNHYETMTVYDADGNAHTMTTYYQKNPHEQNVWDYIVTCEPEEDDRLDAGGNPVTGTAMAGLLQKGKITFDADGKIKDLEAQDLKPTASRVAYTDPPVPGPGASALNNITIGGAYTGPGRVDPATGALVSKPLTYEIIYGWRDPASAGIWRSANTSMNPPTVGFTWIDDLGNSGFVTVDAKFILPGYDPPVEWTPSALSALSGYVPVISYPGPYTLGNDGLTITFNLDPDSPLQAFGAPGQDAARVTAHSGQPGWVADSPNAAGFFTVDVKFKNTPAQSIDLDMGARRTGGIWLLTDPSTTQYGGRSLTVDSRQDGYPQGGYSHLYVTPDGYVMGVYSNKQEIALYQLCITRFLNPWGLQKMGNNLFAATRHSGPGTTSAPGEHGAADVLGGFLEQSNVDTATEIVNMIMTQRGFQANSKVVTTHNEMLATAIELKR